MLSDAPAAKGTSGGIKSFYVSKIFYIYLLVVQVNDIYITQHMDGMNTW